jgi:tRNA (cytidine/uridine-2'-O-)-methyltransferase
MNIVLLEPEIPSNTGNIGRSCMAANSSLHLIRPLGFSTDDKTLKRAGLDYWSDLDVHYYDSYGDFAKKQEGQQIFFASTKAVKTYTEVSYSPNAFIVFGKESSGIPREILLPNLEHCIRIPMSENYRSLNLASSAAIVLYEALRQNDFIGLEREGLFKEFK